MAFTPKAIIPMGDLFIRPGLYIPEGELSFKFARSSGPGGQNVNKVETKVEVRFHPGNSCAFSAFQRQRILEKLGSRLTVNGELVVVSERTRKQLQNRSDALEKLAKLIHDALLRPRTRRATKPSRGSNQRRLNQKKARSDVKKMRGKPERD